MRIGIAISGERGRGRRVRARWHRRRGGCAIVSSLRRRAAHPRGCSRESGRWLAEMMTGAPTYIDPHSYRPVGFG
ncbi:hypothetical protein C6T65_33160 [Burkholderia vietnamiensis]|uniref:Uncharacterized protein n=1 Tax=Burkholderia vietnamiensis TaxID=60552 RepID=A0AA44XUK4_BURVI|nr:hypothetical protein C6T65_33160 [Burkholderia vietnamiensis]